MLLNHKNVFYSVTFKITQKFLNAGLKKFKTRNKISNMLVSNTCPTISKRFQLKKHSKFYLVLESSKFPPPQIKRPKALKN